MTLIFIVARLCFRARLRETHLQSVGTHSVGTKKFSDAFAGPGSDVLIPRKVGCEMVNPMGMSGGFGVK